MNLLCLSKIAILEILQIACANANQNDLKMKDISKCKAKTQNNTLPPKKRRIDLNEKDSSQCNLGEFKNSLLTKEQDASPILEQEQPIEISDKLRIIRCENSAHGIIILAYLSDLEYRRALQSENNTYYEQRINAKEFNQAAFGVLIKQFEQTQFILETIRDARDITTFTAIKKAQDEFKCNILKAIDNSNIQNVSDIQINEFENIKIYEDTRTGFENLSDNLIEKPKTHKLNSKEILGVGHNDIKAKLLEVEAKIMQIKEDIIAFKAVEGAEKHMGSEINRPAIEDSIIKKAEEILNAMYALNDERAKQTMKVAPARNAVEMEKARQTVEDVLTNHALECRLEQHAKENVHAKQKKQDEIPKQAVAIEEARQTEEREMFKQLKAYKNTRSTVDDTIAQQAVEVEITRQAVEIENARKSVEYAIAKHTEEFAFSKQDGKDEIARQAMEREKIKQFLDMKKARQTEEFEMNKKAVEDALTKKAKKNELARLPVEDTIANYIKQNALKKKIKYNEIKKQAKYKKIVRQKLYEKSLLRDANRVITKQAKYNNIFKHDKDYKRARIATEHEMTQQAANIEKNRRVDYKKMFGFTNEDVLSGNLTIDITHKPVSAKLRGKQKRNHAKTSCLKETETSNKTVELNIVQQAETNCIFRQTVNDKVGDQAKRGTHEAQKSINFKTVERDNGCKIQIKTNKRRSDAETSFYVEPSTKNVHVQESRCSIRILSNISLQNNKSENQNQKNVLANESKASMASCTNSNCDSDLEIQNSNQLQTNAKIQIPLSMHVQDPLHNEALDLNTETIWTTIRETKNRDVTENSKHGILDEIEKNTDQSNAEHGSNMLHINDTQNTLGFSISNFKNDFLFKHYQENLEMVFEILQIDQNINEYSHKNTFKANMIENIKKLRITYEDFKEIKFTSYEDVLIYDQDGNYIAISYISYIKLSHSYDVEKLCKENMLFYSILNIFVNDEFLKEDFTFNNLYALIIQKVQKVKIDVYTEKEFNYLKHELYQILKQSSKSTMLYFFEIPKLISYLETRKFDGLAYNIDDVGVYFAILNVFNTLIAKNWNSMINYSGSSNNRNINLTDVAKIVKNEKHRQIFYKIFLYVIRPFVSVKRYQEVWSKNICQDLVVMHLRENWNKKDIAANCYAKLVYYQLYEIFAFEIDTVNNVLINKTDNDNSIETAVKFMINHNNFSNLKAKLGQKIFFKKLKPIISCILKYLKSNEKRNDEEIGISKSYIDYFSYIINNTIDFEQVSFKLHIPNNHLNFFTGNVLINKNNETWYQQLDYYNNLYLVLNIRY